VCRTFTEPQLLCKFPIGRQALCVHIWNKHKLFQGGGALLLLSTGGHSGVKAGDLDSTSNDVVEVAVHVDGHRYGNEREELQKHSNTRRRRTLNTSSPVDETKCSSPLLQRERSDSGRD